MSTPVENLDAANAYDTPLGITNPPIDELLDRASSKYALVIYAAKRARQINDYYNQLGDGILEYVGPLVEPGLQDEIASELAFLARHWPADLPAGVIHADLFPDNVFFLGDTLSGLIDFYFACNDLLAYDVSICLNAWCFEKDGAYNITKGMAMLEGYRSVRSLSDAELAALPILARGSALRFFLTRLYDWLTTPEGAMVTKKDPLEYLRKLRFHRQITSAAEYGLSL